MFKKILITFIIILTAGCSTINMNIFSQANKETTSVLCIGMENSKFGNCPGAQVDATRMHNLLKKYSNKTTLLISNKATKSVVVQKMKEVCQNDLAIIYYSGHGGDKKQTEETKLNFEEPSGKDQFLCLYDGGMLDDEIWSIISNAKGRVVLIFDCCHSGTMFRSANPLTFEIQKQKSKIADGAFGASSKEPNMLCISGCPDDSYSYGSENGGLLTNAILDIVSDKRTYERVWELLHNNYELNKVEKIQFTEIGKSFKDYLIFR